MAFEASTYGALNKQIKVKINEALTSGSVYKGTWNANTNTPTLTQGSGTNGNFYDVSAGGTWNGITFLVGDKIIFSSSSKKWERVALGEENIAYTNKAQTLTNKTINADDNTITELTGDNFKTQTSADKGKTWVIQDTGKFALGKAGSDTDNTTIEEVNDKIQLKDNGITFNKLNSDLVQKTIRDKDTATDTTFATEKAIRTALEGLPIVKEVDALPTTNISQLYLYKLKTDNNVQWYNGSKWIIITSTTSSGGMILEVDTLPTTNIDQKNFYKLKSENSVQWWNSTEWISITAKGGMISVETLPTGTDIQQGMLYKLTKDVSHKTTEKVYEMQYQEYTESETTVADKITYNATTNKWYNGTTEITVNSVDTLPTASKDIENNYYLCNKVLYKCIGNDTIIDYAKGVYAYFDGDWKALYSSSTAISYKDIRNNTLPTINGVKINGDHNSIDYGIYSKTTIDATFQKKTIDKIDNLTATTVQSAFEEINKKLTTVFNLKGNKEFEDELPTKDVNVGDVWVCQYTKVYNEYIFEQEEYSINDTPYVSGYNYVESEDAWYYDAESITVINADELPTATAKLNGSFYFVNKKLYKCVPDTRFWDWEETYTQFWWNGTEWSIFGASALNELDKKQNKLTAGLGISIDNNVIKCTIINDDGTSLTTTYSSDKIQELLKALTGVSSVKVVEEQPTEPDNNVLYYIGKSNPYTIKLYSKPQWYDLGTTEVNLSDYVKKTQLTEEITKRQEADALLETNKQNITDNTLTTISKTIVGAINENKEKIDAMSKTSSIEVVATLPTSPTEGKTYYIGTKSPYTIKLYSNSKWYDMGTTDIDLSTYAKKEDLTTETTNRTAKDTELETKIKTESETRETKDTEITTNLNTEITDRKTADETLQTNINNEATTRQTNDNTLQENINKKQDKLTAGEGINISTANTISIITKTLKYNDNLYNLKGEGTIEIKGADSYTKTEMDEKLTTINSNITTNTNNITTLKNDKQDITDTTLQTTAKTIVGAINENKEKIDAVSNLSSVEIVETLPATPKNNVIYYVGTASPYHKWIYSNDAWHDMGTDEVDLSNYVKKEELTAETEARTTADTTLQTNIDTEAQTRLTNDTTLQTNIDAEAKTRKADDYTLTLNLDNEGEKRKNADNRLQNNIDNEAETRKVRDEALQQNIDNVKQSIDIVQTTKQNKEDTTLETTKKTITGAINELYALINALSKPASQKVVEEKPEKGENGYTYYVGKESPYEIWLYTDDTWYDLGETWFTKEKDMTEELQKLNTAIDFTGTVFIWNETNAQLKLIATLNTPVTDLQSADRELLTFPDVITIPDQSVNLKVQTHEGQFTANENISELPTTHRVVDKVWTIKEKYIETVWLNDSLDLTSEREKSKTTSGYFFAIDTVKFYKDGAEITVEKVDELPEAKEENKGKYYATYKATKTQKEYIKSNVGRMGQITYDPINDIWIDDKMDTITVTTVDTLPDTSFDLCGNWYLCSEALYYYSATVDKFVTPVEHKGVTQDFNAHTGQLIYDHDGATPRIEVKIDATELGKGKTVEVYQLKVDAQYGCNAIGYKEQTITDYKGDKIALKIPIFEIEKVSLTSDEEYIKLCAYADSGCNVNGEGVYGHYTINESDTSKKYSLHSEQYGLLHGFSGEVIFTPDVNEAVWQTVDDAYIKNNKLYCRGNITIDKIRLSETM